MMAREVSASFQAVEDWLRSLGLLHYAQSFYDNGYEDIETCKVMTEEDLNVIDIKTDQDRQDILSGINKLKQNLYFELEPENVDKIVERTKLEPILLKTKLKECLEREKIQLAEPPYYNQDGTPGDLYPLAIRYAAELTTFFDDVLDGLEQLRKRQLSTQNYDIMVKESPSPSKVKADQENRRSLRSSSKPAEYLNCETPCPKRSSSFSKYDTRVTKSTTDLTKDNINPTGGSPKGKSKKSKGGFLGSVFKRGAGRSVHTKGGADFKASELTLTQTEIKDIFEQVKNKEMSQEDALDVIRRRGLVKSSSYDGSSSPSGHHRVNDPNTISSLLAKEAVISKPKSKPSTKGGLSRNRCASAQFYTQEDDISQSSASLISNDSKSSLEISGDHSVGAVEEDSLSVNSKNSPDISKPGIFKKIRNSMRKKNKLNEGEISSEEANGSSPSERLLETSKADSSDTSLFTPVSLKDITTHSPLAQSLSSPTNIPRTTVVPPPPLTPPPPPPVNDDGSSSETQSEDSVFRERTPSLKIKSFPNNQNETSRRRVLEKNNNITKSDTAVSNIDNIVTSSNSNNSSSTSSNIDLINKELVNELNKVIPKIPPRPAPRKLSDSNEPLPIVPPRRSKLFRAESTERQMDELVKEMNKLSDIKADLDCHLQHVNGDTKVPIKTEKPKSDDKIETSKSESKKPELPLKNSNLGWKKPVPPPRPSPNVSDKPSTLVNSNIPRTLSAGSSDVKKKVSEIMTQKKLISKKLRKEDINIGDLHYTNKDGCWCVPYNLVQRYVEELSYTMAEVIKYFDEIRIEERRKQNLKVIPYAEKDLCKDKSIPQNTTVEDLLIHIGLPMYIDDFRDVDIKTIREIKELDEDGVKQVGIFDNHHVTWLLRHLPTLSSASESTVKSPTHPS